MSVERSFEAWEEVQRHGLDLADRLTQGFTGLIQSHINPPSFNWPKSQPHKLFEVDFPANSFVTRDLGFGIENNAHVVSAVMDIGSRLGQAGVDFGANLNGVVKQFVKRLPVPFRHEDVVVLRSGDLGVNMQVHEDAGVVTKSGNVKGEMDEELVVGDGLKFARVSGKSQGVLNISSTFNSRTRDVESSLIAKGDFWRVEASRGGSTSANENPSLFLVQLGPLLFVRDSTLLLPLHLSKQHLLWYGYDRKNGMHSLCPAVWSKHRRWLLMSMVCLNPLACSFMDLQFPNGQLTYVAGEGLSTSAFLPVFGGLLQAQGQYPGEMRFSFSCKNNWGTRITPTVQWPERSFTMGFEQALAWKRSGLMVKPTVQLSLHPTFGGNNPGLKAEIVQSVNEEMNLIGGCSLTSHPSAFASVSLGRSKWNGNVGKSGIVLKVETPLGSVGRPSFSVQLNSGIEF
ncbi:hypothetical protein HanRHA438_Chr03g0126381 [Helianthus annuus]|uniref:Uncharacterized protein n=1 Tax=Helianthus annuus TaxID=4232 RepID=A0A251RRR9_HELAN|nr:uncharacterized protein LOC110921673 [Helianthus annuus]KAF5814736.1 hypothetical protein HanXRQr2_Chr03g0114451 [Helianthus annuus]KAJ0593305.1 hypothetical protein HanHA300_Chr03g0095511 [Helianthus annuus]KAJ0601158.1 hypothetical protein HanIR_Chr03g0125191 [Helianthus annuus]KAJ0608314.1 hypothetical protein HanHA89_Chr03g0107181 [Helianthus annuus]KAJ0768380.1 hypothetical protein HanLR1_Chr03g0100571 [Helianthus annuus]